MSSRIFARTKVAFTRMYLQTPLYQKRFSGTVNRPSKSWTVVRIQSLVLLRPEQREGESWRAVPKIRSAACTSCRYFPFLFLSLDFLPLVYSFLFYLDFILQQCNPSSRFYHRNPEMGKHPAIKFSARDNRVLKRHAIYSFAVLIQQFLALTSLIFYPMSNNQTVIVVEAYKKIMSLLYVCFFFRVIWRDFSFHILRLSLVCRFFRNPSLYHSVISRSIVLFRVLS